MFKCWSYSFLIFLSFALNGCEEKKTVNITEAKKNMIATDTAFSNLSKQLGMKKAFLEYIDDEGVLLRPNHMPLVGADAIDFLSQVNDTSFTLTWEPTGAEVSSAGDMGYTYGIFTLEQPDTTIKGTYVSIWKKQGDGKWKWVVDSGNDGLGEGGGVGSRQGAVGQWAVGSGQ